MPDELRKQLARAKVLSYEKSLEPNPFVEPIKRGSTPKVVLNKKRKLPSLTPHQTNTTSNKKDEIFDIWGQEEEKTSSIEDFPEDWYKPAAKKAPPKEKPNEFKAVEVIEPGASYNPDPEDHKNLLEKVINESSKKDDEDAKKIIKLLTKRRKSNKDEEDISIFLNKETINEDEPKEEEENKETDENEIKPTNNMEYGERKTKAQRNKEKRRKEHERMMKMKQLIKQRRADLENINEYLKEIEDKEVLLEQQRKIKEIIKQNEKYKIKKLGKIRYKDDLPEVLNEDELPNSLRSLSASTSLLLDRLKSLQKRNLLEVRKKTRQVIKYRRRVVDRHARSD